MVGTLALICSAVLLIRVSQKEKPENKPEQDLTVTNEPSKQKPLSEEDVLVTAVSNAELSVYYDSIQEIRNDSAAVVYGEVTDYSFEVNNTYIYTMLKVRVIDSLYGPLSAGTELNVYKGGGHVLIKDYIHSYNSAEDRSSARNMALFKDLSEEEINSKFISAIPDGYFTPNEGDRAVFFLVNKKSMNHTYDITGSWQGEYREIQSGRFRKPLIVNEMSSEEELNASRICTFEELKEQINTE